MQLGSCLALVLVPLLLLATPQRATLHGLGHHAGAAPRRAVGSLARLSTSWTTPVVFVERIKSRVAPGRDGYDGFGSRRTADAHWNVRVPPRDSDHDGAGSPRAGGHDRARAEDGPRRHDGSGRGADRGGRGTAGQVHRRGIETGDPPPEHAPSSTAVGGASWYAGAGRTCASPTLAFGTVVTVTDLSTGASVRCLVDDREARNPGRVIDLSPATFSQLASLLVGVFEVRLSW